MDVAENVLLRGKIKEFVSVVNGYPGVTHNYEREGNYNIWFTLIAPSEKKVHQILKQITAKSCPRSIPPLRPYSRGHPRSQGQASPHLSKQLFVIQEAVEIAYSYILN